MKRLAFTISLLALFALTGVAAAQGDTAAVQLAEGVNYKLVSPPQPTQTGDKIEVLEVFWYGCPHCHDFEPFLNTWLQSKPADVEFRRMPGVFRESWVLHAKIFYTAEALGVLDKLHPALFRAIHEEKRKLQDEDAYAQLFSEIGVAKDDFSKTFGSFTVDSKVRQAMSQGQAYGIEGVPAIIVNGKYQTSGGMTGSYEVMLKVVNALVDKAREESARRP